MPDITRLGQASPSVFINLLFRSEPDTVDRRRSDRLSKAGPASLSLVVSEVAWGRKPAEGGSGKVYAVGAPVGVDEGEEAGLDDMNGKVFGRR